jgi:hypothetical protein
MFSSIFEFNSSGGAAVINAVFAEIVRAAKDAPALYFSPLVGAIRGIRQQYRILERERRRHLGSERRI